MLNGSMDFGSRAPPAPQPRPAKLDFELAALAPQDRPATHDLENAIPVPPIPIVPATGWGSNESKWFLGKVALVQGIIQGP